MEKDTDSRTGWSHDRGCCTHSLFFYRIDDILRDPGTEVGCLGIRVDGLRSDCLALVSIWERYIKLFFSIILVNMNPSDLASHVDDGADGDDEKSNNELRSASARVRKRRTRRTRRARSLARRVRRTQKTTRRKQ